jgi:hypothetical protein
MMRIGEYRVTPKFRARDGDVLTLELRTSWGDIRTLALDYERLCYADRVLGGDAMGCPGDPAVIVQILVATTDCLSRPAQGYVAVTSSTWINQRKYDFAVKAPSYQMMFRLDEDEMAELRHIISSARRAFETQGDDAEAYFDGCIAMNAL